MEINVQKQVDHWVATAAGDFETARVIFAAGKNFHHACFFCHFVVEKNIKALVVRETEQFAPYSHDLIYLAEKGNLTLTEEEREFCELPNRFVIEARYPDDHVLKNGRISSEAPSTREAIELAKRYVEVLRRNNIAVAQAYLYGSFVRGDFHRDSDIDILVVSDEFNHSRFEDSLRIVKLRYDVDLRISPLAYHPSDFTDEYMIPHEAMTHGIRIV